MKDSTENFKLVAESAVQIGILMIAVVTMLGAFWAYCEGHFAHSDVLNEEVSERKELKREVDQLYVRLIPEGEQMKLKHR